MQELQQHALDPVGRLVDVFEKQNAATHARKEWRSQQRAGQRQVAAPERAPNVAGSTVGGEFDCELVARNGGKKIVARECLGHGGAEIHRRWALPAHAPGTCQQRQVKGREVAVAHDHSAGGAHTRKVQAIDDAHQSVTTARRQHEVELAVGSETLQLAGAQRVVPGKALFPCET